jgi:hypothetical protein
MLKEQMQPLSLPKQWLGAKEGRALLDLAVCTQKSKLLDGKE